MRKILMIVGIVLGTVLLVLSGTVRWIIAPAQAVLPSDTNTTRTYTGTASTMLNLSALRGGSGQILLHGVPTTVVHQTKVLKTSDSNALVSDSRTVKAGGSTIAAATYRYAVDRTNMGRGSGYSNVVAQRGVTFNWPIHTAKKNYTGWVTDTLSTTPLVYSGTQSRGGVDTYVFKATTTAARITDPQVLAGLPASIPKATATALALKLGLPAATLTALQAALPTLPDPIPLSYTYRVQATYWVAPTSGIVVDLRQHEVRTLAVVLGTAAVPVTPVLDMTFTDTPATLKAAAKDANDKGSAIDMLYGWLPLTAAITGGVLLLAVGGYAFATRGGGRRTPDLHPRTHEAIHVQHH